MDKEKVLDRFINRLTDYYSKDPNSNIGKLMQIATSKIQENEDALFKIGDWRDIDQAEGKVLDMIGQNVRQNRGKAPDEVYRILIKSKVKRNLSNGSINTLIDFLSFILQIPKEQVHIKELWETGEHATIKADIPMDAINTTGLSRKQFGTLVNLVTSAGVRAEVLFEGTFRFAADDNTPESGAFGFSDDTGTTGGTLGDSFDPADDYALPF